MAEPLRHRQTKGAETDMPSLPPPRHIPTLPRADLRRRRQILTIKSEAMPPKGFEPKNGERGRGDCCPEHYAKLGERLIPAGREPGQ